MARRERQDSSPTVTRVVGEAGPGETPLRVLIVEDVEDDAQLILRALRHGGFDPTHLRVDTAGAMEQALDRGAWDVVISDWSMPTFNAMLALSLLQGREADLPFIIVSGSVGEETAVAAMRAGAHDYVTKERLARLPAAVERELRDAAERRRRRAAEDALRHETARFRMIVEHSSDWFSILDRDGTFRYVSPAIERGLGLRPGDLIGRKNADLVHPDDLAAVVGAFARCVTEPGGTCSIEYRARHADGSWRSIESIAHGRIDDPAIRGVIVATRDVSERRAAAEALRVKEAALAAARARSAFVATIGHELRTPLNAIIGFSELLEQQVAGPITPEQKEYVGHVIGAGRHLLAVIGDMLDLAKIEAGKMALALQPASVAEAARSVASGLQPLADRQGVSLDLALPADAPPIEADPVRLRQIFYNLVSNAVKFTPRGGRVRVSVRDAGEAAEIAVADTGVGIAEADLPRLFLPFEQLAHAGAKPEGTGLGLALTKHLVEMHGGTIAVASTPGGGATFTARLPRAAPPRRTPIATPAVREAMASRATRDLASAMRRVEHLLAATPAVVYAARPDGDYGATYVSPNVKERLGWDAGDFLRDPRFWLERVLPDDLPAVLEAMSRMGETGRAAMDYRFRHADGSWRRMRDEATLVRDARGQPIEIVGYRVDVTERHEQEERWRRLFETVRDAVILVDAETHRVLDANPAAVALLGYARDEMLAMTPVDFSAEPDGTRAMLSRIAAGEDLATYRRRLRRKDGAVVEVEVSTGAFPMGGRRLYFCVMRRDGG